LTDLGTMRSLRDGLALHSGVESVEIQLVDPDRAGDLAGARVSEATIRESRLQQLVEKEPLLERAIQEFDLELMD